MSGPTPYVVKQLVYDAAGLRNEPATDLESLVTHHPMANRSARIENGVLQGVESPRRRSHALIGGEFQEIEAARTDEYNDLSSNQVLLVKDFILEDQHGHRRVDVPAPVASYVGRVDSANALVELYDRKGGEVVARIRHLDPISVREGDDVAYGQTLGTQGNAGLRLPPGKSLHVHLEMDTRYYQHMDAYIADLASGRLPMEEAHRQGVTAPALADDGVQRLGEQGTAVWTVQRALYAQHYVRADGTPVKETGVYDAGMQGAVVAFQRDHKLAQTGDIDAATFQAALRVNVEHRLGPVGSDPGPSLPVESQFLREMQDLQRGLYPRHFPVHPPAAPSPGTTGERDPPGAPHAATSAGSLPLSIRQHPLYPSAREAVTRLDISLGRDRDESSDRLTASLVCLGAQNGFTRIVHAVLSERTPALAAGHYVFAVQGAIGDPRAFVVHTTTSEAMARPLAATEELLRETPRIEQVVDHESQRVDRAPVHARV